jgi:hypothetical protein
MIARFCIAVAVVLAAQMPSAAPARPVFSLSETASLAQTLTTASDPALLEWSCGRLVTSLMQENLDGSPPSRNPQRDASFAAIRTFLQSSRPARARVACARRLYGVRYPLRDVSNGRTVASAYGDLADEVVLGMLSDPLPGVRAGAAGAMWSSTVSKDGHVLLLQAQADSSPEVVAACLKNMASPMNADIAANHDGGLYDRTIERMLRSDDAVIVGGALHAYVARHGTGADSTLRRFTVDKRPLVRREAIDAYAGFPIFSDAMARFMESRLNDPDPAVRVAVYDRLFQMGDHRALPALERIAQTAPTKAQRTAARDAAVSIRTETPPSFR